MNLRERQGKENKVGAHIFGSVPGFEVGHTWQTRDELSSSRVHRPKSGNVHAGPEGVYSVLINRKIFMDSGYSVIYAGPKIKNYENIGMYNTSLIKSCQNENPLRLIRGAKSKSPFAPRTGFRFDGLYVVENFWRDNGNLYFRFKRLINQVSSPWIRRIPEASPEVLNQEQYDDDITPYTSHIRFQSRSISGFRQWKKEILEDDTRSSPNEEVTETEVISPFNNSPPLSPEIDEDTNHPPTTNDSQPSTFHELPIPEEQDDFYIQPQYVGGMPAPKICDVFKEEITSCSGLVVTEVVPQLEGDEEFNESVDYEEEQAGDVGDVESDIDCGDEEIEIDSQLIQDAGVSQIVTATSLSQSSLSVSHLQTLELISEIDIEDGPKFAHTMAENSEVIPSDLVTAEIPPDPRIATCGTVQHLPMENEIKMDCDNNNDDDDDDDDAYDGQDIDQALTQESPSEIDPKIGECLYIYPRKKCENADEVEQAIRDGNFNWCQGNRPYKKKTTLTSYTLHQYQKKLVETIQPEASVIIDNIEQDNALDINTDNNPVPEPLILSKPDSTSQMASDNTVNQCRSGNAVCPYKDITLAELIAYAVDQPLNGCMCHWENRLPRMKYCVGQILRARESNGLAPIQGIKQDQIMAAQHDGDRDRLGQINDVESLVSAGCSYEWHNRGGSEFSQHSVYNFEMVSVDEQEVVSHREEEILQDPLDVPTSNAKVFWRGLEEIRAEALKRSCKSQDLVSVNNDGNKKRKELHSSDEDETSREVEDKVSKERENTFLNHHRLKRKRNLIEGEEMEQSSQTELMNQQNIQTELTRTHIVHINNNLTSSVSISPGKEFFNDTVEDKRNVVVAQVEDDGSDNTRSFESYSKRTPQFLVSSTEKHAECISNEVSVATNSSCDDLVVDVPLKKRLEVLSTRTHSAVSKKDWGTQTAKTRGRPKPSQLSPSKNLQELSSSPITPIICNIVSLSNDNIEEKTPSIPDFDVASNEDSDDLNTAYTRLSSSPSSDTASFERVCNELCEGLPSNKQENCDLKKALPGGDIKRKRRPRARPVSPLKALKELQLPAVVSKKYVPPRLNTARNLKGFTSEDVKEIKRKKDILDVIIEEHLVGSFSSNKSKTASKKEECTMKKSDGNLRPKSTRQKQKVLSDNACYF